MSQTRPMGIFAASLLALAVTACQTGTESPSSGGDPPDASALRDAAPAAPDAHAHSDSSSGSDSAGPDSGATGALVPAFVAQGTLGRTTLSCDGGRSWVANRDDAAPLDRCGDTAPAGGTAFECFHLPSTPSGISFGNGVFVATLGHGLPGEVRRSVDGRSWAPVVVGESFAGVLFLEDEFFLVPGRVSGDGLTWSEIAYPAGTLASVGYLRRSAGATEGGRSLIVLSGDDGLGVSEDHGRTWSYPSVSAECRAQSRALVGGDSIVLVRYQGSESPPSVCASTDRGMTFAARPLPGAIEIRQAALRVAGEFMIWGTATVPGRGEASVVFRSTDGASWSVTPTEVPAPGQVDVVAQGGGVFVGVAGEYETQRFFRSEDGLRWQRVDAGAHRASHAIWNIAFGMVPESACAD